MSTVLKKKAAKCFDMVNLIFDFLYCSHFVPKSYIDANIFGFTNAKDLKKSFS